MRNNTKAHVKRLEREADTAVGLAAHAWMVATNTQEKANKACDIARVTPTARAQAAFNNAQLVAQRARLAADDADAVVLHRNRKLILAS